MVKSLSRHARQNAAVINFRVLSCSWFVRILGSSSCAAITAIH